MRELKFRAWLKKYNCYADVLGFGQGRVFIQFQSGERSQHRLYVPIEDCILEQYTGLKDKNGKEIYEGDIVEFGLFGRPERGYVAYADEYASFEVYSKRDFIFGGLFSHAGDVIGSIHENADLLEEEWQS